jgi:hypothetical protein
MVGLRLTAETLVVQTERAGDEVFAVIETGDNTHLFLLRHLAGENDLVTNFVVVCITIEIGESGVDDTHCFSPFSLPVIRTYGNSKCMKIYKKDSYPKIGITV